MPAPAQRRIIFKHILPNVSHVALVQLSLLMADEDINLQAASALIETDMALAAAVMKAVNSSLYGLKGRVQSVQQAITYLARVKWRPSPSRWGCARPSRRRPSWSRSGCAQRSAAF